MGNGKSMCGLYATEEEVEAAAKFEQTHGDTMTSEQFQEMRKTRSALNKTLDELFDQLAKNLNMSEKTLGVIVQQKASTERNLAAELRMQDNLDKTGSMLSTMQRGMFSFTSSTRNEREEYPTLPPFACDPKNFGAECHAVKFIDKDIETNEMIQEFAHFRFGGSFVWVVRPDLEHFTSTIPYQTVRGIELKKESGANRIILHLVKSTPSGEQPFKIKIGAEDKEEKGKKIVSRHTKSQAKPGVLCSNEDIVEQFVICCAAVGNPIEITYGPTMTEADHFKHIVDVDQGDKAKGPAARMKRVREQLMEMREELKDCENQRKITLINEAGGVVLKAMLDFSKETQKELDEHCKLLDLEYDLLTDANETAIGDMAKCDAYIADNA